MFSYWWSIFNVSGFCGEGRGCGGGGVLSCCLASFPPAQLFGRSVRHFLAQLLLSIHAASCWDSVTGVEGCWELMLPRGHSLQITKPGFPPMQSLLQRRSLQHRLPIWRFLRRPAYLLCRDRPGPHPHPTPVVTCFLIYGSLQSPNQVHRPSL